jgi:hypothetical protein
MVMQARIGLMNIADSAIVTMKASM